MANIRPFEAPDATLQPSDRAMSTAREAGTAENIFMREAGQALGKSITQVGGQIGEQIDRHVAAQQIGHGAATYSSLYGDLTGKWNELASKADPNDTSIYQGFKEKILEPSIEQFQKAFENSPQKVQDWALTRSDEMRQHFVNKMSADMGTRAAMAVHKNLGEMERNYSNAVSLDPSALPHVIDSIDTDVAAQVAQHQLNAGDAARVKAELIPKMQARVAQSAFDGMAQRNPQGAIEALDHGDFNKYADAVTQATWRKYAEGQQKIQDADAKADVKAAKDKLIEDSANRREDYIAKMQDQNTGRILPVQPKLNQQINNDVRNGLMTRSDANFLINWNDTRYRRQVQEDKIAAEGPPMRSDAKVLDDLRKRVGDPDQGTTRQEVSDAMAAGQLTTKDAHDLAWRVGQQDAAWQASQREFKSQFDRVKSVATTSMTSMLKYLPADEQLDRLNQVEADGQRIVREAYATHDKQIIHDVMDTNSPKWWGKQATQQISGSPKAAVAGQAAAVRKEGVNVDAERADAAAAIAAGKKSPEAVKALFKQRTGQDFDAGVAKLSAQAEPATYEEFAKQQDALKPAVEAKGWKWEPDRWNYSVVNGQLERSQSGGREWIKYIYPSIVADRERKARDAANK